MGKSELTEFLRAANTGNTPSRGDKSGLIETQLYVEMQQMRKSIAWAVVFFGLGLGFLALHFGNSWVVESPLFSAIGTGASLLSLIGCWLGGALWWLFTASQTICLWAKELLPFGIQPYRSIAGIPGFFIIVAVFWNRKRRFKRLGYASLAWLRRVMWLSAGVVWVVAVACKIWDLMK